MDSISLKMPVTIKAKLTENLRKRISDDLSQKIQQVTMELQQIDIEEKRVIQEQAQGNLQALQAIRQHFAAERQQREMFKADTEQKLSDINKLALGAEIVQGQLERQVEVKVGDDFHAMMNVEVLIEDGKVIAIRG
ncbi:MAG: YlqD family protein [Schwartzia sp.]|nr:YlqD family protein [Schwartzia sp. (in: firmicutes)]